MIPARQEAFDDLFAQASVLTGSEREAFLDSACTDPVLRAEIQRLLTDFDSGLAATAPFDHAATRSPVLLVGGAHDPLVGRRIGPYLVQRRLGRGGFGAVYLAIRIDDFRQQVAIKVLRTDLQGDERILARFELERQLLADLQHEHIARLLYGGATDDGQPYIAMEYVRGESITHYSDAHRLTIGQRLALFRQVCQAVAFAHSYSVIHRDIKPGNILVTNDGSVKLLDFGIAKMVGPLPQPMATMSGDSMPMTPEYASPEQVRGEPITTATDVYSLGVVLFELLTGRRPYEFSRHNTAEIVRVICDQPPRRPSTIVLEPARIRRDDETVDVRSAETLAEPRGADPQKLQRLLAGDLEQIILMALRKEPQRRYATVEALVQDLDLFEQGRTVTARPLGRLERAGRWVRRNRTVAALATAAALALIGGTVVSTYFAIDARRQADVALSREKDATAARRQADAARKDADNRRQEAERLRAQEAKARRDATANLTLLLNAFERVDPKQDGRTFTVAQALDRAEESLAKAVVYEPLTQATVLYTIGRARWNLGLFREAVAPLEKAYQIIQQELGPDDENTLGAMNNLANAYVDAGRLQDATSLYEKTLDAMRRKLGPTDPFTLNAMDNLATTYADGGRYDESIRLHEECLAARTRLVGGDHPDTLSAQYGLATACFRAGQTDRAIALAKSTLAAYRKRFPEEHPDVLNSSDALAAMYHETGQLAEAIAIEEPTVAAMKIKFGPDHPGTLLAMGNLAGAYLEAGQTAQSIELYEVVLAGQRQRIGVHHQDTLKSTGSLALAYQAAGRLDEAVHLRELALRALRDTLGAHHPDSLVAMDGLARAYWLADRPTQSMALQLYAIPLMVQKMGINHPATRDAATNFLRSIGSTRIVRMAGNFVQRLTDIVRLRARRAA